MSRNKQMSSLKIIINSRPGKCAHCKTDVGANAGKAFTRGQGWQVACLSVVCHEKLGLIQSTERSLRPEGPNLYVRTPKDTAALPLIRSFPGAQWNQERSLWSCSAAMADRARVLEIADQLGLEVDPSLREIVLPAQAQAAKERASDPRLYPFQRVGVEYLALHDRALLADDMGLGKTVQALLALPHDSGSAPSPHPADGVQTPAPVIVICPASLKLNWRDECKRWRPDLTPVVLEGRKSFRAPNPGEMLIVNYDILPEWLIAPVQEISVNAKAFADTTLIVDEGHACKNYKAKRSQKRKALGALCARDWTLTGTPLLNHPPDLWGVLEAGGLAHTVFGSFARFQRLFHASTVKHGRGANAYHTEYGKPDPEVSERLKRAVLRRLKSEVLPDLPRKTYKAITVNGIPKSLRAELDALESEWGATMELTDEMPPFEAFSSVRATLAESRIDAMIEIVESYEETGTPLVVFSAHRSPIDALSQRPDCVTITGDTAIEARREAVTAFQSGVVGVIGLTIAAGGVGLTLTHGAHVLFVDLDWTPALNAQAEDRCCRIGQTADAVQVMRMVSDHPLDKHITRLLGEKIAMIAKAVDSRYTYERGNAAGQAFGESLIQETEENMLVRKATIEAAAQTAIETAQREKCRQIAPEALLPRIPLLEIPLLESALDFMLARCDGAVSEDGMGFNKPHAALMRWLIGVPSTIEKWRAVWSILRVYRRQLEGRFPELFEEARTHEDGREEEARS